MKTIKERANDYAETRYSRSKHPTADAYSGARNGFLAGVEEAQYWIGVDEALPELDVPVLVKTRHDIIIVAYRARETNSKTGKEEITWRANFWGHPVGVVGYWRPIELK
jgi:hypothetical protein